MQIRPLREEDKAEYRRIEQHAFVVDDAGMDNWMNNVFKLELTRGLFDDNGKLLTAMDIMYPEMFVGGGRVPMPGLAGVATPPEHRRHHYLDQLLMGVLNEFREKGYGISTLYPFYFPFYKKYGYEHASMNYRYTIKTEAFSKFKPQAGGQWLPLDAKTAWERLNPLYESYYGKYNGSFTRDQTRWKHGVLAYDNSSKWRYVYVWQDDDGRDQAYIIYRFIDDTEPGSHGRKLVVREYVFNSIAARHELFAFIGNHDSQAEKVQLFSATSEDFLPLFSDPRLAELKVDDGFMLRIVDAKLALEQRPYKTSGDGAISIALTDNKLAWNDGITVRLQVENGQGQVEVVKGGAEAGLVCDIRQLAQLYIGYQSPRQLVNLGLLQVNLPDQLAAAQRIFAPLGQPASYMMDWF